MCKCSSYVSHLTETYDLAALAPKHIALLITAINWCSIDIFNISILSYSQSCYWVSIPDCTQGFQSSRKSLLFAQYYYYGKIKENYMKEICSRYSEMRYYYKGSTTLEI
jgi:hypothetical protein